MIRPRLAAVVLLGAGLGLGVVACSDGAERSDAAERSASTTAPSTTTTVPDVDVRVLDPGAEPRRELRYRLAEGTSTPATFTTDLELEQERAGVRQRLDAPPVRQTLAHRVAAVADDGTATVESEVVAVEVRAAGTGLTVAEVDELQRQLDPLARSTSTLEVGPRGEVRGFEPAPADGEGAGEEGEQGRGADGSDDLVATVLGLAPVLPEEPVGVGARWQVVEEVEIEGRTATVQRTYALTALDDAGFSWELDLTLEGAGTFAGEASGTNRWDAPVGELTARLEGERWLDAATLEPVAPEAPEGLDRAPSTTVASSGTGPTTDPDGDRVRQELVLAYRATASPPDGATAPTDRGTAPAGQAGQAGPANGT